MEIYGPYRDGDYFKMVKWWRKRAGGSVKASHILFAYEGAQRANADITRTKEEAKAEAEKILKKQKRQMLILQSWQSSIQMVLLVQEVEI